MKTVSHQNEIATLSTVLLSNLDEVVFFSKISGFIHSMMKSDSVLTFEVLFDGSTRLTAQNGMALNQMNILEKGQGLSGHVTKTKRAYYSNSIKRDPVAFHARRDESIEAELCVPIMVESSVIGTINIQSNLKNRQFGEQDIALINELLTQLSAPIKNMHLYLMAKNLNRELLAKIEAKEKELSLEHPNSKSAKLQDSIQLIGTSKSFLEVGQLGKRLATQDFPLLIEGNHGVGKKTLAKKIHAWSGRRGQVVVASCSAMNEAQLDREIFSSKGLLVQAHEGSLILDDVGHLSHHIQTKILRFLVTGEMVTVDTEEKVRLNVRLISTSKISLKALVEAGSFKEELFYRINSTGLKIPALREREEDIKVLAEHFLNLDKNEKKILTSAAIEKLNAYHWPGNYHELKNIMERTHLLIDEQYIEASHLPEFTPEVKVQKVESKPVYHETTLYDLEKKHIVDTLDHLAGNKTRAAKTLGITVKTLYNKLHSYGLIEAREQ